MTAKRSAADANASYNFRLVPDANLAKLNPGLKYGCKILYQLTEIDSSICRKIKKDLVIIKCVFHIDKFHR